MGDEYGKRGTKPRTPLVDVGAEEDVPVAQPEDYLTFLQKLQKNIADSGTPTDDAFWEKARRVDEENQNKYKGVDSAKSMQDTPNKQALKQWLKRTYNPLAKAPLKDEDIPDIHSAEFEKSAEILGKVNREIPYNVMDIHTADAEGDIDFKDPRTRSTAFHEAGHILSGVKDADNPATGEFVPFYRGNVTDNAPAYIPNDLNNNLQRSAEGSMQPFDTTYLALKKKLDAEDSVRRKALGQPNIIDRAMQWITGDKPNTAPPSAYYNASGMRKKMLEDNAESIKAADERIKQNPHRMNALKQMQDNPYPTNNGR